MRPRNYPYGAISWAISAVMRHTYASAPSDIMQACQQIYAIDRETTWRNLRSMCSRGIITNVGTRQKALYVLKEKA